MSNSKKSGKIGKPGITANDFLIFGFIHLERFWALIQDLVAITKKKKL